MTKISIIGAGTMGHGIAQVAAMHCGEVALYDVSPEAVERGRASIEKNLDGGVERGKVAPELRDQALQNLSFTSDFDAALTGASFVVEAIVENLDVKREVFAKAEPLVAEDAVLASNTSSLPIGKIARDLARPERLIGMHFFNPVHIQKLVEIVISEHTSEETKQRTLELSESMGKDPIVVKDSPGFASSRLGVVLGLEAMRMVEQGVASPADIDKAMELGYRHPMGPLRLTDLVGLDVRLSIAKTLSRELVGDHYQPPAILERMVREGKLGKKSGEGFYSWS